MYFSELPDNINNKIKNVILNMKNTKLKQYSLYKELDDKTLLNLSFRLGDKLHCQWASEEEELLLPILVSNGYKPTASISNLNKKYLEKIIIPYNCDRIIIKNRWNIWLLIIFLTNSFTYNELVELANETNLFNKRGYMLGYGEATFKD